MIRAWLRECWPAWASGIGLGLLLVFVAGPMIVPSVVPMSRYYELRSVTVSNTEVGTSPRLLVDWTIHRDFRGRLEVEIMRAEGSEFVSWWVCGPHVSDWQMYRRDTALPPDLNLDRWMMIPPNRACPLPPGTYKVVTTAYARGPLNAELSSTTESNVFEVTP